VPKYTYKINPMFSVWVGSTFYLVMKGTEFSDLPMDKTAFAGVKVVCVN